MTVGNLQTSIVSILPDGALVCTSPISHGMIVLRCLEAWFHVFTEIDLMGDWYEVAMAMASRMGLKLFISSTFLYRREIEVFGTENEGSI